MTDIRRSEPVAGLRLLTEHQPGVRSVAVGLWVPVGSQDEPDEVAGVSHLLEHLVFKGTARRSAREIADALDAVGGELNAYTGREHTCFYARVLDEHLELAIDVICDMLMAPALREPDVASEKRVVLEEIAMAADVPEELVHERFNELAWPDHPLGRPVIGRIHTVDALDRTRVVAHHASGYAPGGFLVAAAGSVDHDAVAAALATRLPASEAQPVVTRDAPTFAGGASEVITKDSEQAHLVWGLECPSRHDDDRYALGLLNAAYGAGVSSRLFQQIREERGLAYSVYSGYQAMDRGGIFSVYAGTSAADAPTVCEIVRHEAADMAGGGLTEAEVERAKGLVKGSLVLSMDDPGGRMSRIGRSELHFGEVITVDELLARIDAVTTADVERVAKRVFAGSRPVLCCVGPLSTADLDAFTEPLPT